MINFKGFYSYIPENTSQEISSITQCYFTKYVVLFLLRMTWTYLNFHDRQMSLYVHW